MKYSELAPFRPDFWERFDTLAKEAEACISMGNTDWPLITNKSYPKFDIYKTETSLVIQASVPGYRRESLSVELRGNALCIYGESQRKKQEEQDHYYVDEIKQSAFRKRISLNTFSSILDTGAATAKLRDGILTITIPKMDRSEEKEEVQELEIK